MPPETAAPLYKFVRKADAEAEPARSPAPLISDVWISLAPPGSNDRYVGSADVLLAGAFALHRVRLIRPSEGREPFVAMPSSISKAPCPSCRAPEPVTHQFCCQCGHRLDIAERVAARRMYGAVHRDLVHPIHDAARAEIHDAVLAEYRRITS